MPPTERQAEHEICGINWDYRVQDKEQLVSQQRNNARSFPICLEANTRRVRTRLGFFLRSTMMFDTDVNIV